MKDINYKIFIFFLIFLKSVCFLFGITFHFSVKKNKNWYSSKKEDKNQKRDGNKPETKSKVISSSSQQSSEKKIDDKKPNKRRHESVYKQKYKKKLKEKQEKLKELNITLSKLRKDASVAKEHFSKTFAKLISEKKEHKQELKKNIVFNNKSKHHRDHQTPSYLRRKNKRQYLKVYRSIYKVAEKHNYKSVLKLSNLVKEFDEFDNSWIFKNKGVEYMLKKVFDFDVNTPEYAHFAKSRKSPYLLSYDPRKLLIEISAMGPGEQERTIRRLGNFLLFGTVKEMRDTKRRTGR